MTRALVTGSSGFLGRYLVQALARRYDTVDRLDLRPPVGDCAGETFVADLRDVLPALGRYDAVFHLAANVGGRAGIDAGPLTIAGNLTLDVAFFDYVARTRPAHAVYLSSSAVYPDEPAEAFTEACVDPCAPSFGRPEGTYGWVKLTGEHLAHVVRERYGVPVVCYRPFTVYGPHQGGEYPVTAITARALDRADPLTLWGSGRQARDFVYVADCVEAIAATHAEPDVPAALNVCTGVATDFHALACTAAGVAGYAPRVAGDPSKPSGVARRVGSPHLLARWFTPRTSLADGVRHVAEWLTG